MKIISIVLFGILFAFSASYGSDEGFTENSAFHFNAYIFDAKEEYKIAGEGEGSPEVCKHLFTPPVRYDGRYIQIPKEATAFGVIAVTNGKTSKIIPLFAWVDDNGAKQFGCNGPTIWYARQEDSADKLINSIIGALKNE